MRANLACNKFNEYIYDKEILIKTNYKPLEIIFQNRNICCCFPTFKKIFKFDLMQNFPNNFYIKMD